MIDFLNNLRIRNLFDPSMRQDQMPIVPNANIGIPDIDQQMKMPMQPMQAPIAQDPMSHFKELYTPDTAMSNMYTDTLAQQPHREDPGMFRKIVASMVGLKDGPAGATKVLDMPFDRNMKDWTERIKALQPGMQYEKYANSNERLAAQNVVTAEGNAAKLKLQQETEANKNAIAQKKIELAQFKQKNPTWKLVESAGGNYHLVNPTDPNAKPVDTGIPTGSLSDMEKLDFGQANALERIGAQGDQTRETEGVRQQNRLELEGLRNDVRVEIANLRTSLQGQNKWTNPVQALDKDGKPLPYMITTNGATGDIKRIPLNDNELVNPKPGQNNTQAAVGLANKARAVAAEHPEWAKYIKIDKDRVDLTAPGRLFGPSKEMHDQIYNAIYGTSAPTVNNAKAPTGKMLVTNKEGKRGYIPADTSDAQLNAEGYTKVQ